MGLPAWHPPPQSGHLSRESPWECPFLCFPSRAAQHGTGPTLGTGKDLDLTHAGSCGTVGGHVLQVETGNLDDQMTGSSAVGCNGPLGTARAIPHTPSKSNFLTRLLKDSATDWSPRGHL